MIEPKHINDTNYKSASMRYEELLQKGIDSIQKFSGKQWTDYNYHDPGITLLEQISYAITDLGYKTNFPIEDLLLSNTDDFNLEEFNLFIAPSNAFSSAPTTYNDFRKIIIEQISNVKNAWVHPIEDNLLGLKGLYSVLIQFTDDVSSHEIESTLIEIEDLLMKNRSIGTDIENINVLKKDHISISGDITLNSFALGETVLAEIYQEIEKMFNQEIRFQDYDEMEKNGIPLDQLFAGPVPVYNYLDYTDFKGKTTEIYLSEIKEIIINIEGVLGVKNLVLYKNGIKMFNDLISFNQEHYPSLDKNIENFSSSTIKLNFKRNESFYEIDPIILSQIYNSKSIADKSVYKKIFKQKKIIKNARFKKEELEHYYSIQNELPSIYGLRENEIPSTSNKKRKSQVKQLKAYLFLFEQIMANYLSQLSNVRTLFSLNKTNNRTYFNQIPLNIPELESVLSTKSIVEFVEKLNALTESKSTFYSRKNYIIDHLLSRFDETFSNKILSKLVQSLDENENDLSIENKTLNAKIEYAKQIVELGQNRILGFNYNEPTLDFENISGLEKRLKLILNIKTHTSNSLTSPFLETTERYIPQENWTVREIELNDGSQRTILSMDYEFYIGNEFHFHCYNYSSLKSLFLFAHKLKNYQIVKSKKLYHILYKSPNIEIPVNIFTSTRKKDCQLKIKEGISKFKSLNIECEGLFLIEHLLLRPMSTANYTIYIYDNDESIYLESLDSNSFEEQRNTLDDIYIIALNPENYSIKRSTDKKEYEIILYDILNNPILKYSKKKYSKVGAKSEVSQIIAFFKDKKEKSIKIENFSDILIKDGTRNEFPEDFNFSNHISFIFPDWPLRFQNSEFTSHIKSSILQYIPAHISFDIYYLDINQLYNLEDNYMKWIGIKKDGDKNEIDVQSLLLVQLLKSYQAY